MSNSIEFSLKEIAEAVSKGHLARYAKPHVLKDEGANEQGIIIEYSPSTGKIRFSFLAREMDDTAIFVELDAKKFVLDPVKWATGLHRSMHLKMEEFHASKSSIILPNGLPARSGVQHAISKEIH